MVEWMEVLRTQLKQTNKSQKGNSLFRCQRNKKTYQTSPFTNKIRDCATIGKSSSGVVEESFPIGAEICLIIYGCVDIVIISSIKKWIPKDEKCIMLLGLLRMAPAAEWNDAACPNNQEIDYI